MKTFIGIDGGGTHSRLRVIDLESKILFESEGESTNVYGVGFSVALSNLRKLISSYSSNGDGAFICIASAGLGRPEDCQAMRSELKKIFNFSQIFLCSDIEALIVGGLDSLTGAGLICGTGSIAMRRLSDFQTIRSGGMGWKLGDEGSAWYMADQAVRRAMRSKENRDLKTSMLPSIIQHFNAASSNELIRIFNSDSLTKSKVASFAPTVLSFSEKGDPLAMDIVSKSIEELALLVTSLFDNQKCPPSYDLLLAGGVFENNIRFRTKFETYLLQKGYEFNFSHNTGRALEGAVKIAKSLY